MLVDGMGKGLGKGMGMGVTTTPGCPCASIYAVLFDMYYQETKDEKKIKRENELNLNVISSVSFLVQH